MSGQTHDILVAGSGMVGAAAACLLARAGFTVAIVDSRPPPSFDAAAPYGLRVSALSPGSAAVLAEAGAWRLLSRQRHCPYRRMQVEDRGPGAALEFTAGELGLERLGTIVENDLVQHCLAQSLETLSGVEWLVPASIREVRLAADVPEVLLEDGRLVRARLLVGADGADSAVRREMGVGCRYWDYGQQGIVGVVKTSRPNPGLAWQRFLAGGPIALLPLADGSSSIVWSVPDADARRLLELDDAGFLAALNEAIVPGSGGADAGFGEAMACGPRAAFPLRMQLCDHYVAGRAVLIGDAAHVIHPLAGQGVNLGLLDAAALTESLLRARQRGEDFPAAQALRSFARWRRSDAELLARGIHGIRLLFTPDLLTPLRRLGLRLVSGSWLLKEAFARRAAGLHADAPALARGVKLTELLRQA